MRPHPALAFHVNEIGAYNVAKACVACGTKRLIHTGPFHSGLGYDSDGDDFRVGDDIPIHPADDLYALTNTSATISPEFLPRSIISKC